MVACMDSAFDKVSPEMLVAVAVCNSADMAVRPMESATNTAIVWPIHLTEMDNAVKKIIRNFVMILVRLDSFGIFLK